MREAAAIRELQDEYERETGTRPSRDVASVLLDRQREADSYREVMTPLEMAQQIEEMRADAAAAEAHAQELADCAAGLCDHYTCTEGQALAEWEAGRRHQGLDR